MRIEKTAQPHTNTEKRLEDQLDKERHDRLANMLRQTNEQHVAPVSFAPPGMRRPR